MSEKKRTKTGYNLDVEDCPHCTDIPPHTIKGFRAYVEDRRAPGGFLTSVLANDFVGAVSRADWENRHALKAIAEFVGMHLPEDSHGSVEAMHMWLSGTTSGTPAGMIGGHAMYGWRDRLSKQYAHLHHPGCSGEDLADCVCGLAMLISVREILAVWLFTHRDRFGGLRRGADPLLEHLRDIVMVSVSRDIGALNPFEVET